VPSVCDAGWQTVPDGGESVPAGALLQQLQYEFHLAAKISQPLCFHRYSRDSLQLPMCILSIALNLTDLLLFVIEQ